MDFFSPAADLKSFHFLGPVDPIKEHIKAINQWIYLKGQIF